MYERVPRGGHFNFYPRTEQEQQREVQQVKDEMLPKLTKLEPMLEFVRPNERRGVDFVYCDFTISLILSLLYITCNKC